MTEKGCGIKKLQNKRMSTRNKLDAMYEHGIGLLVDYIQVARWYQRAAENGDTDALGNLGVLYEKG